MVNEKRKIRFLINTLAGGGAEKVLMDLLCKLNPEKYDISLVTIENGTHSSRIPEYVMHKCILQNLTGNINKLKKKIVYKLPPRLFSALFLRGKYDIEVAYLEGTPTHYIATKTKSKKIAFVHCDFSVGNFVQAFYKTKERCFDEYCSFDRVCFVSNASKEGFESVVGQLDNSCVIHNVLNYENIRKLSLEAPEVGYTTKGLRLITAGRLVKEKGYDRLLRVVSKLEKEFDFELLIAGDGEEKANLEQMIKNYDIKSAKLIGFQKNPYPYFKIADLFVCSSYTEGYSTVVTEAVSLGLPVVTTDCAGMNEILCDGKYGLIVDNNEEALYMGLKSILSDKKFFLEMKDKAILWEKDQNTSNELGEYLMLFDDVLI